MQRSRGSAVATVVVAALLLCAPGSVRSQSTGGAGQRGRDTAAAAAHVTSQVVTAGVTYRAYSIGDTSVSERGIPLSYDLSARRVHLRIDGTSLRYTAASAAISGTAPVFGRLDFMLQPGDTVSLLASSASRPAALDAVQTAALGASGAATIPLESFAFGTPSLFGGRAAFSFIVGETVLSVRGGVETEPRPAGTLPVFWRGTTVSAGSTLEGGAGETRLSAGVDYSHSSADSLGGRNLFPGGGDVSLHASLSTNLVNPFDALGDVMGARAVAFFDHPFGDTRNDQPNLLVPLGNTMGANLSLAVPIGDLVWSPSIDLVDETSAFNSINALTRAAQRNTAGAWAANLGLDAIISLGSHLNLTPQAGFAVGNVDATVQSGLTTRRGRTLSRTTSFSDGVRGWWSGVELSISVP